MKLIELFNTGKYSTDKGTTHAYIPIYDMMFEKFSKQQINILEVGIHYGGSILLWRDYFVNATIFGYDVVDLCTNLSKNINKVIKNANNISPDEFKNNPLTIAIDDGSHILDDQLNFVRNIFPQMAEGGFLIIEDIQDIVNQKQHFDELNIPYSIIDLRIVKNRYDDVLLIFKK